MKTPRVPLPLLALLGVVLTLGFAWALLVPPGLVPDEPNHIQYTQSIAERFEPWRQRHARLRRELSEQPYLLGRPPRSTTDKP